MVTAAAAFAFAFFATAAIAVAIAAVVEHDELAIDFAKGSGSVAFIGVDVHG